MKKFKFWVLVIISILLAFADGLLTFINTPDLSMEGNPLVAKLGLGWEALVIANIIIFALVFITAYYSYFKYKTIYTNETKFTYYCSQVIYDLPDMFWKGLIPKHITPYLAGLGFSALYALIIARAILVFEWLCITFNATWSNAYFSFRNTYCLGRVDVFVAVIFAVTGIFYWFYKEYKKQLNNTIKEFFFYHHGDGMSMDRDDPQKYKQYRTLSEVTIELWRQELIAQDFELLINDNADNQWIIVGNLIMLISSSNNLVEDHFKKLLTTIVEISPTLNKRQRILILEHFVGRTLSQEDGGIHLIQSKANLNELLKTAINTLLDFACTVSDNTSEVGWENIQQRYDCAKKSVQSAFQKFNID